MKKIKKEFEDLMLTKTEGKMIEQLMVCQSWMQGGLGYLNDHHTTDP